MDAARIITIPLDDEEYEELQGKQKIRQLRRQQITDDGMWYIFLDEVQLCKGFEAVPEWA